MEIKNISYFRQDISTNESIRILDCGYHETIQAVSYTHLTLPTIYDV